jgi:hypothetical protein
MAHLDDCEETPVINSLSRWDSSGRARPRVAAFMPADRPPGLVMRVELEDVSEAGIWFVAGQVLKPGQVGTVTVRPTDRTAALRFDVTVRWAVFNDEAGRCRVGCTWQRPPSDVDLARMG